MTSLQSEVRRQIVPDWRSSSTECYVAEVGPSPTEEKCTSVSRAQSSWASVGDEATVVGQVAGSASRERLVNEGGDLELDALPHWKPVQLMENR